MEKQVPPSLAQPGALRPSEQPAAPDKNEMSDEELETVTGGVRDAASGLPTGKRSHLPVSFTKEYDKSSPQ